MPETAIHISSATARNWNRLGFRLGDEKRLTRRANKTCSARRFLPKECLTHVENLPSLEKILDEISSLGLSVETAVNSLCLKALLQVKLAVRNPDGSFTGCRPAINAFVAQLSRNVSDALLWFELPDGEEDILGVLYQCLLTEGVKNVKGMYFTPAPIVKRLLEGIDVRPGKKILDPCCGTGGFLLAMPDAGAQDLYGMDVDPLAVQIAKTNLFIRFKNVDFEPAIFCTDALLLNRSFLADIPLAGILFDIVASNPPWGAQVSDEEASFYPAIVSRESFSLFLVQAMSLLKEGGDLRFLLPESILNVRVHEDCRRELLAQMRLDQTIHFDRCFQGVFTKVVGIVASKGRVVPGHCVQIYKGQERIEVLQQAYAQNVHAVFTQINEDDRKIVETIFAQKRQTLSNSVWGLGIVTGDNVHKLLHVPMDGCEPIYTGKEVAQYRLDAPTKYIRYEREQLQQVAPDVVYRAPEKLVYKFISRFPVFAYDNRQCLVLNSANVLIPKLRGISIKAALLFLNSDVVRFLYLTLFNEIKILRGNLEQIPFPMVDSEMRSQCESIAEEILSAPDILYAHKKAQSFLYKVYHLSSDQIIRIKARLYGEK